jgi:cell wall-associated NlpC family hydrolase
VIVTVSDLKGTIRQYSWPAWIRRLPLFAVAALLAAGTALLAYGYTLHSQTTALEHLNTQLLQDKQQLLQAEEAVASTLVEVHYEKEALSETMEAQIASKVAAARQALQREIESKEHALQASKAQIDAEQKASADKEAKHQEQIKALQKRIQQLEKRVALKQELFENLKLTAKSQLGKKYVWGAIGPTSFDCSGFTSYVCKKNGIHIPRTSRNQSKYGKSILRKELKRGDLIFFDTSRQREGIVNHVGIYLGNNRFIHASSAKKKVVISKLDGTFYGKRYQCARRVIN